MNDGLNQISTNKVKDEEIRLYICTLSIKGMKCASCVGMCVEFRFFNYKNRIFLDLFL